jgi:hypothetical protein
VKIDSSPGGLVREKCREAEGWSVADLTPVQRRRYGAIITRISPISGRGVGRHGGRREGKEKTERVEIKQECLGEYDMLDDIPTRTDMIISVILTFRSCTCFRCLCKTSHPIIYSRCVP